MELDLLTRTDIPVQAISAAGLRGKNPLVMGRGIWTLTQGYRQSYHLTQQYQPDVLFVTGGYVCVPVTLAARRLGVPILIYLPDIEPGLAIKFLARFADRVAITTEETEKFFKPGLTTVTGYPVRAELNWSQQLTEAEITQQKAIARHTMGLRHDWPVLMVFGGSRGARSINNAILQDIENYLAHCQIIHVTGQLDADAVASKRANLPTSLQSRYHIFPYLHEQMIIALQAADLAVSRAGASVLGEFPALGLPSILIPYPHAGAHQQRNADYLTRHNAAFMILDVDIMSVLRDTIINLMTSQPQLEALRQACWALAKPHAAQALAQQLLEVTRHGD